MSESSDHGDMTLSNVQCHKLVQTVLKSLVGRNVFSSIDMHMFDHEVSNNHIVLLIKAVIEKYLQVRYFYAGKKYTMHLKANIKSRSRQVMNKLVLFSGQ